MSQCWCEVPADRPTFPIIRRQLEVMLSRDSDYLDLDNIDAPINNCQTDDSAESQCGGGAVIQATPGTFRQAFEMDYLGLHIDI